MNSVFTSISGQFGQFFILGTFVPVVVFVILFQVFVTPLLPNQLRLLLPLETIGTPWQVVDVSFLALVFSALLYNVNIPIIRFYEGYPWEKSWIGKKKKRYYQAQLNTTDSRRRRMLRLQMELATANSSTNFNFEEEINQNLNEDALNIVNKFSSMNYVLPTRLGNTIRSFEFYPYYQYRIDSITLWPRLIAKIDKDYAAAIDAAKASFDFMINSSFLSALLTLALLCVALVYPSQVVVPQFWFWLSGIIIFAILTYLFYLASIGQASAWGDTIKAAFDLYRADLLKQLGYKRTLVSLQDEQQLWDKISLQMIYGQFYTEQPAEYIDTSFTVCGEPPDIELLITRGFSLPKADGTLIINIDIKNLDPDKRICENVIVTEVLPNGLEYIWDSARINSTKILVLGINPYQFFIGDINFNENCLLTYCVLVRKNL